MRSVQQNTTNVYVLIYLCIYIYYVYIYIYGYVWNVCIHMYIYCIFLFCLQHIYIYLYLYNLGEWVLTDATLASRRERKGDLVLLGRDPANWTDWADPRVNSGRLDSVRRRITSIQFQYEFEKTPRDSPGHPRGCQVRAKMNKKNTRSPKERSRALRRQQKEAEGAIYVWNIPISRSSIHCATYLNIYICTYMYAHVVYAKMDTEGWCMNIRVHMT